MPFGAPGVHVQSLDDEVLSEVMDTVNERLRLYLELREKLPFEALVAPGCLSNIVAVAGSIQFDIEVACAFGMGSGSLVLLETDISVDDVDVKRITITYRNVVMGELGVDGVEEVIETGGPGGASVRTLDVVQNGVPLTYEFRIGLLEDDQVVIDYRFVLSEGTLLARVSNPTSVGAMATVTLTGIDGALVCELRNTPWAPGMSAKGVCDNGLTFGLPESVVP